MIAVKTKRFHLFLWSKLMRYFFDRKRKDSTSLIRDTVDGWAKTKKKDKSIAEAKEKNSSGHWWRRWGRSWGNCRRPVIRYLSTWPNCLLDAPNHFGPTNRIRLYHPSPPPCPKNKKKEAPSVTFVPAKRTTGMAPKVDASAPLIVICLETGR